MTRMRKERKKAKDNTIIENTVFGLGKKNFPYMLHCNKSPILTWDGLPVEFYPEMFEHAFYKRTAKAWKAKKDSVDFNRCKRLPWINEVLHDSTIVPRQGYDKARGKNDNDSRIALVSQEKYVVVIRNTGKSWRFVTAYLIDNIGTYNKLMSAPVWVKQATSTHP